MTSGCSDTATLDPEPDDVRTLDCPLSVPSTSIFVAIWMSFWAKNEKIYYFFQPGSINTGRVLLRSVFIDLNLRKPLLVGLCYMSVFCSTIVIRPRAH